MPYFELETGTPAFPPAHFADPDGLLATGGELTADWLTAAYRAGIYLWCSPMEPLYWWSPDPRIVLFPDELKEPASAKKIQDEANFQTHFNRDLNSLLKQCEEQWNRPPMSRAWLSGAFIQAYLELQQRGRVRFISLEQNGKIQGGAFGALIGKIFFCEYVCQTQAGWAELALLLLARKLQNEGVICIDLHKDTAATDDIGYREISKNEFLSLLAQNSL